MEKIQGKRVLVTGADGFIGSHLTEMLVKSGAKVRALSQYNSFNDWGWLEQIDGLSDVEVITGDVRDPFFCDSLCRDIEIVYHLAALIAIPYSYIAPASYIETNISGTLNICQAVLKNNCERLVHTSTSEVYGSAQYVPIDEEHPLQPQSPYSASKIGADSIAMSFYNSFNLPLTVARPFNTFGPRQSARAVIPTIISQIAGGMKVVKLGDLRPTRDFNYVLDTCGAMIVLSVSDKTIGEVINIGTGYEYTMGNIFERIKAIFGSDAVAISEQQRIRPEKSEVLRLCCDNKKLHQLTNYQHKYDLDQGLAETVAWFSKPDNLNRTKISVYNV